VIHAALLALALAAGSSGAGEHVLAGARAFRAERWAEALVEFRVAEKLGDPRARGYAGAALLKLDRPEQALEAFEAPGAPPAGRDPLLDYYHALACHELRLFVRADRLLAGVGERSGPRVARQAADARAELAAALRDEPSADAVDWYGGRCSTLEREGRRVLARAFCEEAAALGARRKDRHGVAAAQAALSRLRAVAEAR
jgi:hypothetical protein